MRAGLNLLTALAATWVLAAGVAEARCDLTDPTAAAPPAPIAPPEAPREPSRVQNMEAFSASPRQPVRAAPQQRAEPHAGRSVTRGARSAIPDTALMRKRRIL